MKKDKSVVVIGGGTGIFSILTGLKRYPLRLTAIVSMADDGGSTGVLREEFGILPPGDIRRALVALSGEEQPLANLLNYRFSKGSLNGHSFGNLLLTALTDLEGDFGKAIKQAEKILAVKGQVIPVTLDKARLQAELKDGQVITGETNIDVPKHDGHLKIKEIFLKPSCSANPLAIKAIQQADLIIIGPGDLYTSIIPNLLVQGITQAIKESKALKVYVGNIMTKFGETYGFQGEDFVKVIEDHLGENILDFVLFNNHQPTPGRIERYAKEKAQFVKCDPSVFLKKKFKIVEGDFLRPRGFIRHDSDKTSHVLFNLLENL